MIKQLVVDRKNETMKQNDVYGEILQIYREIGRANKEKSILYNQSFGKAPSSSSPGSSSLSKSPASGYLDGKSTYRC
jgi:hypothetical protein